MSRFEIENYVKESLFLLPDSLIFGSFLFSLITLSSQHGLLFFSILESLVFLSGYQSVSSFLFGEVPENIACKSSLFKHTFEDVFMKPSANIPSYGMYIVTFVSSYLVSGLLNLKSELNVLDTTYLKQYNFGLISLGLLVIAYSFFRVNFKCDSTLSIILALFLGVVTGFAISYQNQQLFGRDSTNFLGIPLIRNKTVNGEPIYICS